MSILEELCAEFKKQGVRSAVNDAILPVYVGDNTLDAGIYQTQAFMSAGQDGKPGIQIVNDLENFKREVHRYMFHMEKSNKNTPNKPVDKDNHLMDCMRYMVMGLPPFQEMRRRVNLAYVQYEAWKRYHNQNLSQESISFSGG
jgi:hypothetical protein